MRTDKAAPVITIDGASGTGKGVVARLLATQLGWHLLDSGVLYRVLALSADQHGIATDNEQALQVLAGHLDVSFVTDSDSDTPRIFLEGQDVTGTIRSETVGSGASKVGILPGVRAALLQRQRAFREPPGLVTDGRDMGTVVFPDALVKIFLTASPEERARRRHNQLKEMGVNVNLSTLAEELCLRDKRDQERAIAPLRPADDAVCIDTDQMTIQAVVERIALEVKKYI